jgi:flavin reductase (DIM6/NTAB) family NADH-FMN oxidoreductase RutF
MNPKLMPVDPCLIKDNAFKLIGADWMLITAGTTKSFNTMTANWGTMGELWNKKIAICFIRPVRHTYTFMEQVEYYTLSFFDEKYRDVLRFCGSKSGREVDKIAETGLTPRTAESGAVYFEEARLVMECKKIYIHDIDPAHFLDAKIDDEYPKKDYHRMYVGEVVRCLLKKA